MRQKVSLQKLKGLSLSSKGLTESEVKGQLQKYGANEIAIVSGNPILEILKETIKDPMIWFLVTIGLVFIGIGEKGDAFVLLFAIVPLLGMDAFLHWRTSASTSELKGSLATISFVLRNGIKTKIDSVGIVPGDLVVLSNNEYIPADGLFIESQGLQIDESNLTGESFPISKHRIESEMSQLLLRDEDWFEKSHIGHTGTRVLSGSGLLLALATGKETDYSQIVQSVASIQHERTPLQIEISRLVKVLIFAAGFLCLVLASVRLFQGKGLVDAFLSAATLAIAAIPEEFPVVFTFFLGVGVFRLAKKHALVRRAVSVENIGRINRICTDKTGTITLGQLKLTHLLPGEGRDDKTVLQTALNASNSKDYDPIDQAILERANLDGVKEGKRIKVYAFTEERKCESIIIEEPNGAHTCFSKGAPETIFSMAGMSGSELALWREKTSMTAQEGHRVLACASKKISPEELATGTEPNTGFTFSGLLAFEDPPRPEVIGAMKYCRENNIKVTMITGDLPETASAIARDIELSSSRLNVVNVEDEPEKFTEDWLRNNPDFLKDVDVIARCKPMQKLYIVSAFRAAGELVAVTGDGVNDVPALKAADISIAMGVRGTSSAKEISHLILTDDNFSTIVNAVAEGRQLFYNLKKSFEYLVLFHIPFVLTAALIPLFGYPLLYLPVHIVWLELIIHPTALFAFQSEVKEGRVYKSSAQFFSVREVVFLCLTGVLFSFLIVFQYIDALKELSDVDYARSRIMATLCLWSATLVAALIGFKSTITKLVIASTVVLPVVLIQTPYLSQKLHLTPMLPDDWGHIGAAVGVFALIVSWLKDKLSSP